MDQPDLDEGLHRDALRGLERINALSRSARAIWQEIRQLTQTKPLRVLDLACGAGDNAIGLWHHARRSGVAIEIAGADLSPRALEYARKRAEEAQADVRFFQLDALKDDLPAGYDVITCSLFLHHLGQADAVALLKRMGKAAGRMVIVHDLRRCRPGLIAAQLASRLLTRSPVVRFDGPQSVRAAFTVPEVRDLAREAGLQGAVVEKRWPWRLLLRWVRA
jgi:ubiquinone/menaquinone biosynthesis C-methylase UbiE